MNRIPFTPSDELRAAVEVFKITAILAGLVIMYQIAIIALA